MPLLVTDHAPRIGRALTIRARLAISYGAVMVGVLIVVAVAVGAVHQRLGLARIDTALTRAMQSVAGVVASEITELSSLDAGAGEALFELELPGMGVSVLGDDGRLLAARLSDAPELELAGLQSAAVDAPPRTLPSPHVRVAASKWQHGDHHYVVVVWESLDAFEREHATVMRTVALAIPFAALAALIGGWLVVWRALKPLSAMAAQVDTIDRRHLEARLPVPDARDDFRRLAVAFNGLLDRLAAAIGAQGRFMADASHELRTPVSVVRTAAQVTLSQPHREEGEYREALDIVTSQAARLTHVVDDMFLLAVADVGGRPLVPHYVYLDELVAECIRALAVLARQRDVRISLDAPDGVEMRGDVELLRRMVTNLLDNATRHSPPGAEVRATISLSAETIRLCVQDAGPGIPECDRQRIFERFVRLDAATAAAGGGLGLPIARWVAEQHGGTLTVESDASGSRFIATFARHPTTIETRTHDAE